MKVSTRFGEIDVNENGLITLTEGLVGRPQAKRFCLVAHAPDSCFHWLQCIDDPGVALPVISPTDFFSDYSFDLQTADVDSLGLIDAGDAVVLTTVAVDTTGRMLTTNLLGPIIVNKNTMRGKQVVLSNEGYSTKHLLLELKPAEESSGATANARAA